VTVLIVIVVVVVIVVVSIVVSRVLDVVFRPAERVIDRQVNKAIDKLDERQQARTQASQVRPPALGRASFTRLGVEVASASGRVMVRQIPFGSVGDRLGLRTGDVIERVNGQQVRDVASLDSVIVTASGEASRVSASKLTVDVVRSGGPVTGVTKHTVRVIASVS
jgi:S1-C subfamily serine protease